MLMLHRSRSHSTQFSILMTNPVPANWVPDDEGGGCSICHAEFSLTRRRHHCRKCGGLVCGSCSNHFMIIDTSESGAPPVRVCDRCELQLSDARAVAEDLDVNDQINLSLKASLKEKAREIDKFQTLIAHIIGEDANSTTATDSLELCETRVKELCASLRDISSRYSEIKMESHDLEKEIRIVAQRCLRAESIAREGVNITRDIERYSKQIGNQDRLIEQLTERIDRLTNPSSSASPRTPPRSPSPPPASRGGRSSVSAATVLTSMNSSIAPDTPNVCQILKALIRI
jgi:hypothetical protein